jgi:UDP-N-acetylglucosamine 2-epimerase (non-hydrolysing)
VLDKGTVIIGGVAFESVSQSIELSRAMHERLEPTVLATDYRDKNVSVKVVKIIQSYTGIINDVIWRK